MAPVRLSARFFLCASFAGEKKKKPNALARVTGQKSLIEKQ
jgi:hypothetical protein